MINHLLQLILFQEVNFIHGWRKCSEMVYLALYKNFIQDVMGEDRNPNPGLSFAFIKSKFREGDEKLIQIFKIWTSP